MKKVFTLLTLLLGVVVSVNARDISCSANLSTVTSSNRGAGSVDGTNCTLTWYKINSGTTAFNETTYWKFDKATYVQLKLTSGSFIAGDQVSVLLGNNNSSSTKNIGFFLKNTTENDAGGSYNSVNANVAKSTTTTLTYTLKAEDIEEDGSIKIFRGGAASSDARYYSFSVTGTRNPSITTQPVGANYVTGDPIIALTIAATASAGELSYQWYVCDDAIKTNAVAIGGATNSSFTPSAAGFYFCRVTDSDGSVDSNVVEVSIAAAAAPTISVSDTPGAAVLVGTPVTMTATLTGNPSPTIQWYSNTTATNTGGTEISGATSETYSPSTASAGVYYFYAVATNSQGSATSDVQTVTIQEKLVAPTIETPSIAFVSSIDIDITDNSGKSATIKYSTDGGTVWNDYSTLSITAEGTTTVQTKVVKDGYFDSDVVTTKYKKVASLHNATTVSEYTVWDWTKATTQVDLDDTTIPSRDAENVNAADFDGTIYENVGWKSGFNAQALVMSKFQRPFDSSNKAYQGTSLKFTTTVPGAVKVEFCNTGSSSRPYRYLYVNGDATSFKSNGTSKITTDYIPVAAGEVELKGVIKAGEGADVDTENYLRVFKVTFAPTETATITTADYATFVPTNKVAVPDGVKAYIVSATTSSEATLTEVSVIPAGEPVIINKDVDADTEVTFTATDEEADDVSANNLKTGAVASADGTQYILADGGSGVGFYQATPGTAIAAGKAYLVSPSGAPCLLFNFFDDMQTTGVNDVRSKMADVRGDFFDLQGRKVANPTKGLYIVNGKKFIVK